MPGEHAGGHVEISLPADVTAPRLARRELSELLVAWGMSELREDAVLLVSELVSNAIQHGDGPPCVVVTRRIDALHIAVLDGGGRIPRARHPRSDEATGRGLELVDAISHRWGTHVGARGTEVWFELRGRAARNGTDA